MAQAVSVVTEPRAARRQGVTLGTAAPFLLTGGLTVAGALPGGSYDLVVRQEAGIAVWWLLALGFALGLLPRSRPRPVALIPAIALVALGGWILFSLGWTESDERTLAEASRVACYLGLLVLILCTLDRHTWRAAAAGLVAGALVVAALSTGSRLVPGLFPSDPVRGFSNLRLNYPFDYWNAVGAWGAMAVTGALAWSVAASRPALRAAFLASIPVAGLSIYLSYSRAALAGVVVGALCVLILSPRRLLAAVHLVVAAAATGVAIAAVRSQPTLAHGGDASGAGGVFLMLLVGGAACAAAVAATWRVGADSRWRVTRRTTRLAIASLVSCVAVAAAVVGPGLASRAWDSFRENDPAAALPSDPAERLGNLHGSRYSVWSETLEAFRSEPSRGSGAGTFEFTWNRSGRSPEFLRDAHSIYLEPLAELGWPGALLMLAFLASLAVVAMRALRRGRRSSTKAAATAMVALLAVFIVQAGGDWMWESTAVAALALAAAAIASMRLSDDADGPVLGPPGRIAACVGSLAICLLLLPGTVSVSRVRASQSSAAVGDLRAAAAEADDAVAAAPWAASALLQRGLVAEARGNLVAARGDIRDAARREPQNWRMPFVLARVEASLGHPRAARWALRRARRLRPRGFAFQPRATGRR